MKITIVTATLGKSHFIVESLGSVSNINHEVNHRIVAPAGINLGLVSGRILIPEKQGIGLYGALNQGFEGVDNNNYILFLNDDDALLPEMANMIRIVHEANYDFGIGDTILIDEHSQPIQKSPSWPFAVGQYDLCRAGIVPFYQVATIIRCDWLRKVGGFRTDLRLASDLDLYMKVLQQKPRIYRHHKAVALFRIVSTQLSADRECQRNETKVVLAQFPAISPLKSVILKMLFRLYNFPLYMCRYIKKGFAVKKRLMNT